MNCPVCKISLVMSDRNGVEIDYCPSCRGVWLDRGELDKIIERAEHHNGPHIQSQPHVHREREDRGYEHHDGDYDDDRHDTHSRQRHKNHKKETFLGDLFDF